MLEWIKNLFRKEDVGTAPTEEAKLESCCDSCPCRTNEQHGDNCCFSCCCKMAEGQPF
ncbi:hypothetical protein HY639_02425 [Candidatus Woesearchaeota archaeon]|nr:hypothetical protein [Candidatus Woesearchaeota archaeon]